MRSLHSHPQLDTARPSPAQHRLLDAGLSLFVHYSPNPWWNYEHGCVREHGWLRHCIPPHIFDPPAVDTDQWARAAVSMGAREICLTAHHEDGFCLWDTKQSNYSVMHSPYGRDIVKQFVESCRRFDLRPCFYMGPNSNGWLTHKNRVPAATFVHLQLGMLTELLTNYGSDYVARLWWDHYYDGTGGCEGWAACPEGAFPAAWPEFIQLVRTLSPSTIICPGPDCLGHVGYGYHESGLGWYPAWMPCQPQGGADGAQLGCAGHNASAHLRGFQPLEACATMANGWFCKGNGSATVDPSPIPGIRSHKDSQVNRFWSPRKIWNTYMASVGIGWINTLNAPACTNGLLPEPLVRSMATFGESLRALMVPVTTSALAEHHTLPCSPDSSVAIELDLAPKGGLVEVNAFITREDLRGGQRVRSYVIERWASHAEGWVAFPTCVGVADCDPFGGGRGGVHGQSVGARVIDLVSATGAAVRKVRLRCTASLDDSGASIRSFSAHVAKPPP